MAHKTLIGGTAYEISGGRTLIGGTGYGIEKGKTLAGGTAYTISFQTPISKVLNDCTWEEIRTLSDAGMAANYYAVGDTKTIAINGTVGGKTFSSFALDVFILGFDHNPSIEGTNRIHFQLGKINGVAIALSSFKMNDSATNLGGWKSSKMRTSTLGSDGHPNNPAANSLLAALPADLRSVMKFVTKYTDNEGGGNNTSTNVSATEDCLWLLSPYESHGSSGFGNTTETSYQKKYAYYSDGNSTVKYSHSATTTAIIWSLRSASRTSNRNFTVVDYSGSCEAHGSATGSYGIAPAFCV